MRKSLLICVALLFSSPAAHAQSAADILAKVSSVYAGCTSYADEATSNTLAADNRGSRHTYFRTSFVRPDSFRFELWFNASKPGAAPPWMVWKNRDLIRSSGTPGGVGVQNLRLDTGLARLAAFSGGGSIIIPQMLLPEFFRTSQLFSLIVDAKVTGEEKVDGRRAFRIEGTLLGLPIKLWIDKTDYLLLKSYRRVSIGNREEEATVQYKPKLNISIPPENLAYSDSRDQNVVDVFSSNSLTRLPTMPPLAPRLRELGSSLSSSQKAGHSAQSSASDDDVVRVETDLVVCAVLVLDAQGKIVRDLTAG
ncbi:MAG TPA: hypothetical protein VKD91_13055, partial [Pyrinomonadaceae bacterium]|nr:hypothetical protein [Pyrinomonadaceae bacterium]